MQIDFLVSFPWILAIVLYICAYGAQDSVLPDPGKRFVEGFLFGLLVQLVLLVSVAMLHFHPEVPGNEDSRNIFNSFLMALFAYAGNFVFLQLWYSIRDGRRKRLRTVTT